VTHNEKVKNYNFYEKQKFQQNKRKITTAIAVSAYILDTIPHKTTKCAPLEHNTLAYNDKLKKLRNYCK
jgi:CxxC motif-containing protein